MKEPLALQPAPGRRYGNFALSRVLVAGALVLASILPVQQLRAEDGYELWLRYRPVESAHAGEYRGAVMQLVAAATTPTQIVTRAELRRGLRGLLGAAVPLSDVVTSNGALIVGTPASSPLVGKLELDTDQLGGAGYLIRSVVVDGHRATVIAANDDLGALYGAFHFLRLLQTRQSLDRIDVRVVPRIKLRVLNHWDNLDGHVERGYAGASIWDWHKLPDWVDRRYTDYARANASLGINGTVLNNVNSNALSLTPMYLAKAAALANVLRPYGIRVYLSARFSAPM